MHQRRHFFLKVLNGALRRTHSFLNNWIFAVATALAIVGAVVFVSPWIAMAALILIFLVMLSESAYRVWTEGPPPSEVRSLDLTTAGVSPGTPYTPLSTTLANGEVARSVLFTVTNNDTPCRLRATLMSQTVRGLGEIDYPQGDTVLRMQTPQGEVVRVGRDETVPRGRGLHLAERTNPGIPPADRGEHLGHLQR